MRTILIFSAKGGCAKTTTARELAVAAALEGRAVAMGDLDRQAGLTQWFGRREAEAPSMIAFSPDQDLAPIAASGVEEFIIDTPPGIPGYVSSLIAKSDLVLVPVRPSPDDLSSAASVVDLLSGHPKWAFVLTQTLPRSRMTIGAIKQLAALGRVAPVTIGLRQDFPLAAIEGKAAVETPSKSAVEVKELRSYIATLLGDKSVAKARSR